MIWFDADTGEAVAPGQCEDGGEPSITHRYCRICKTERPIFYNSKLGLCEVCREPNMLRA